jgi:hypothetical protein
MKYYLRKDGVIDGPYSADQIRNLISIGKLAPPAEIVEAKGQTLNQLKGATDWASISSLPDGSLDLQQPSPAASMSASKGSEGACIGLGVLLLIVGAFFLLNPSAGD